MDYDGHTTNKVVSVLPLDDNIEVKITNGDFSTDAGWVIIGQWVLDNNLNEAQLDQQASPTVNSLSQTIDNLIAGNQYLISYELEGFTGVAGATLNGKLGEQSFSNDIADGIFSVTATAGINSTFLTFSANDALALVNIKNVSISVAYVTQAIDVLGFDSIEYMVQTGAEVNGFDTEIEHADSIDFLDSEDVPSDQLVGDPISFAQNEIFAVKQIGDVSGKRFHRLRLINLVGRNIISVFAILRRKVSLSE